MFKTDKTYETDSMVSTFQATAERAPVALTKRIPSTMRLELRCIHRPRYLAVNALFIACYVVQGFIEFCIVNATY
jgi:hypothetical protein